MGQALTSALLLTCCLAGCGVQQLRAAGTLPKPSRPRDRLWVGVAQVDITPPIGLGMWAQGPESRVSTGIAQRLRCQVFVFSGPNQRTQKQELLALVPCDLPAAGLYLQREIASYLKAMNVPIGAQRIALMATHAHYSFGHFLAGGGWTGPFSGRLTGFDHDLAKDLAVEIGAGITRAYYASAPARIRWGYKNLRGIARNRSIEPLLHDAPLPAELKSALLASPTGPELAAVDPLLSVMRIDCWNRNLGAFLPTGVLAFYGVHPTVIGNHNSLFTGDLFGYATRHASRLIGAQAGVTNGSHDIVVGLANGLEGDVTPARATNTHRESRRLGHLLGAEIAEVWSRLEHEPFDPRDQHGTLDVAYRELHWTNAELSGKRRLCDQPSQGTPAAGGAPDHPTSMRIWAPADPGVRAVRPEGELPCGWPRYTLIGIRPNAPVGANYPDVAPIMIAQIGRGLIATAPAELTTVTGYRARAAIAAALPDRAETITMVGLTNEYVGYIATREEYQLQHYEGASTLYGPDSAEFLKEQLGCLAASLSGAVGSSFCSKEQPTIDTTIDAPYTATALDVYTRDDGRTPKVLPTHLSGITRRTDDEGEVLYGVEFAGPDAKSVRHWKDLEVYVKSGDRIVADGRGDDLRVLHDDRAVEQPWRVEWIAPAHADDPSCGQILHFELKTPAGPVRSKEFPVSCNELPSSGVWP